MASRRVKRVNQLIRNETSQIILREVPVSKDSLVTITRVECSPDLKNARVFVGIIPSEKGGVILSLLNRKIYFIQQALNKKLKMKTVPKIVFVEEKKTEEAARIERILETLKREKK